MQLTQQETKKIQERDEQHANDLKEWKKELSTRRQTLEETFQKEIAEKELYYSSDEMLLHHKRYSLKNSLSVSSVSSRASFHEAQLDMDPVLSLPRIGENKDEENGPIAGP